MFRVVVDTEEVNRGPYGLQVTGLHEVSPDEAHGFLEQLFGIAAEEHRVEEPTVEVRVDALRGGGICRARGVGCHGGKVERDSDLRALTERVGKGTCRETVSEQQVVSGEHARAEVAQPWGVISPCVAGESCHPRFVQSCPEADPVAERSCHDAGIILEPLRGVPARPAPLVLEGLGQVPVVKRDDRLDVAGTKCVHESQIVVQSRLVDRALAVRLHAWPCYRKTISRDPELRDESNVRLKTVVVVTGNVAVVSMVDRALMMAEGIPDRWALAIVTGGTFYLV